MRRGTAEPPGLEWIGPAGTTWTQTYATRRGLAPYYNLLDPRVQDAVLEVLRELVERRRGTRRSAGWRSGSRPTATCAVARARNGSGRRHDRRFEHDTNFHVPGEGRERFATRAAYLLGDAHREAWLQWRADQCHRFYRRVQDVVHSLHPDAPRTPPPPTCSPVPSSPPAPPCPAPQGDPLGRLPGGRHRPPALPGRPLPGAAAAGARRHGPELAAQAVDLELAQLPEADSYFHGLPRPGSLFFHPPQEVHIPSFDQRSPFKQSFAWLVTEAVPSGARNRQRFVHSLATMDSQILVDGGWLLPLGQEDALRNVVAAYRRLPPVRFAAVAAADGRLADVAAGDGPHRDRRGANLCLRSERRPVRHRASAVGGLAGVYAPRAERNAPRRPLSR